ncbi:MAG: hypothetical protein JSW39_22250 [Desulfobacterales bacterium]|nr:MAG: hypothetical protein JSW39_22250 [Desulfobacterales bacterium]
MIHYANDNRCLNNNARIGMPERHGAFAWAVPVSPSLKAAADRPGKKIIIVGVLSAHVCGENIYL